MGHQKLHKTFKKRERGRKSKEIKSNIIDVPISKRISLGSFETIGETNYHYQSYSNIYLFFTELIKKNNNFKKLLCFPDNKNEWMNTFLTVNLDDNDINSSELVIQNISFVGPEKNLNKILDMVLACENKGHRFFVLTVRLVVPGKSGSHANMLIIDLKAKKIELFEPHGKRSQTSTLDSLEGAYHISDKLLKKMFSKILPKYKYISPQFFLPIYGLQAKTDAYTGLCVTWAIMYLHYRLLNPNIKRNKIILHILKINQNFILRYVKYIEEIIKKKIKIK